MRIGDYFRQLDQTIERCPGVWLKTMLYDERSETKGFVRGIMQFADGSELHVREFVDVSAGIDRYKYSYHYMRVGRLVFRYDNATDIPGRDLKTYPHHKHVGEAIEESPAPTLQQVLTEIIGHLP
jgi:hypothetical protein